jgi:lysozyme family protein
MLAFPALYFQPKKVCLMAITFNNSLRNEFQQLFNTCLIKNFPAVDACVNKIVGSKSRYQAVSARVGAPWYFIGILHNMECSGRFDQHLHNGDPLTARTIRVPAGFPKTGKPPFTWEASAEDALRLKKLDTWTDWSIPAMLFKMEQFNGFGYRVKGINSPYLWSFSNHYTKGKFTRDGIFDPNAGLKTNWGRCAAAPHERTADCCCRGGRCGYMIKKVGSEVVFNPTVFSKQAETLQVLLNSAGQHLRVDGKAGENTSDAFKRISGEFLQGDSRAVPQQDRFLTQQKSHS